MEHGPRSPGSESLDHSTIILSYLVRCYLSYGLVLLSFKEHGSVPTLFPFCLMRDISGFSSLQRRDGSKVAGEETLRGGGDQNQSKIKSYYRTPETFQIHLVM